VAASLALKSRDRGTIEGQILDALGRALMDDDRQATTPRARIGRNHNVGAVD
jgi:hypothetical protein